MTREIGPPGVGCFDATFPSSEWRKTPCVTVPMAPHSPAHSGGGIHPHTVGDINGDTTANVAVGIGGAQGNFTASAVAHETDSLAGTPDTFSYQINTNTFQNASTQALCQGSTTPASCKGWQQFIFQNTLGHTGSVAAQYWLIDFNGPCPLIPGTNVPWNREPPTGATNDCWMNGPGHGITSMTAAAAMASLTLGGIQHIAPANDVVYINQNGTTLFATSSPRVFDLNGWFTAEFNVFGRDTRSKAIFDAGSSATGHLELFPYQVVWRAPFPIVPCSLGTSFTGETSNMTMGSCTNEPAGVSFQQLVPCSSGLTPCGGACVNVSTDIRNCGACGNFCTAGGGTTATCSAGTCGTICARGNPHCVQP